MEADSKTPDLLTFDPALLGVDVPHLDQYFGVWSILEDPFRAAVARVGGLDLKLHVEQQARQKAGGEAKAARGDRDYQLTDDGVAVISLRGPLMKYASSLSGGTSTVYVRRAIRGAVADEAVRAIVLLIDSPGGTVAGTYDLAADVAWAAKQKRVVAFIEDLGASAAYWIASQASAVYANATAIVGSLGTFAVIYDQSAQAKKLGIKVHVVRAGAFKGAGTAGTEVTEAQLAEWQRVIDQINEHFIAGVSAGRKLSQAAVRELADGRVHVGAAAVANKLIDGVQSFDEVLRSLSKPVTNRRTRMSENDTTATKPQAAGFEDLKLCCPGADNDFICAQLGKKATVDQAQSAWMEEQNARIAAAEKKAADAKAAQKKPGVDPLGGNGSKNESAFEGDAVAEFGKRVREQMQLGMTRPRAVASVARADKELHRAYVAATNPGNRKVQELIEERFAQE